MDEGNIYKNWETHEISSSEGRVQAMKEGMPYQTLVSSIIHKYLAGRLVERKMGKTR